MEQLQTYISTHPYLVFLVGMVIGALLHWSKKAYRGDVSWNPIEYWIFGNQANSFGALGFIVLSWWGAMQGDIFAGATWMAVVTQAVTAGWVIDSGINKPLAK